MANLTSEQLSRALVQLQRECELRWYVMDASSAPSNWSAEEYSFRRLVVSMSEWVRGLQESAAFEPVLALASEDNTAVKVRYLQLCEFWAIAESCDEVRNLLDQYRLPVWRHHFASDTVAGGTDWWTLGATGLQVSHQRGVFLVHLAGKCLGGIKLVFGVTPKQYFTANGIPAEGTLAAHSLRVLEPDS
ncbi:MAG: hypothetical protein SFV17_10315 [Candidatus Obscuribacter sp.]|nr:hypothetical protein [Candidatus Obscuribacter sp.]